MFQSDISKILKNCESKIIVDFIYDNVSLVEINTQELEAGFKFLFASFVKFAATYY